MRVRPASSTIPPFPAPHLARFPPCSTPSSCAPISTRSPATSPAAGSRWTSSTSARSRSGARPRRWPPTRLARRATRTRRKSAWRKGRARTSRRCSPRARRWPASSKDSTRSRPPSRPNSTRSSSACRTCCTTASRTGATSRPTSRCVAGARRASSISRRSITSRSARNSRWSTSSRRAASPARASSSSRVASRACSAR